jgi:hypothetical protein
MQGQQSLVLVFMLLKCVDHASFHINAHWNLLADQVLSQAACNWCHNKFDGSRTLNGRIQQLNTAFARTRCPSFRSVYSISHTCIQHLAWLATKASAAFMLEIHMAMNDSTTTMLMSLDTYVCIYGVHRTSQAAYPASSYIWPIMCCFQHMALAQVRVHQ